VTLELNLGGFNRKFLRIERWVRAREGVPQPRDAAHMVAYALRGNRHRSRRGAPADLGVMQRGFPSSPRPRKRGSAPRYRPLPITSHFSLINSATARSIWRSRPSATLLGSFMTSISGSTWVFSI
jgi:hypothetical protein